MGESEAVDAAREERKAPHPWIAYGAAGAAVLLLLVYGPRYYRTWTQVRPYVARGARRR